MSHTPIIRHFLPKEDIAWLAPHEIVGGDIYYGDDSLEQVSLHPEAVLKRKAPLYLPENVLKLKKADPVLRIPYPDYLIDAGKKGKPPIEAKLLHRASSTKYILLFLYIEREFGVIFETSVMEEIMKAHGILVGIRVSSSTELRIDQIKPE